MLWRVLVRPQHEAVLAGTHKDATVEIVPGSWQPFAGRSASAEALLMDARGAVPAQLH